MQCIDTTNHKVYNLTVEKKLPEWHSDQERRKKLKEDAGLRNRIELIQDFEMPILSTKIRVSKNQQYIMASGVYKPRVRCFDVNQKSMKFDRCMDAEVETFQVLGDDYTKMVFLQNDRFVEFHNQAGCLYRTRIPMYGRDFDCLKSKAELFFVGCSNEIIRMNMEKGMFMNPIKTDATEILCCQFNDHHEFLVCGTNDGRIQVYDHRTRGRVSGIDCKVALESNPGADLPGITTVKYSGDLLLGAGTSTGQILLFDIRSSKPLNIKDHRYGLPIQNIDFSNTETNHNVVISSDSKIIKIWERDTGRQYTYINPEVKLHDVCLFPNSGMLFVANETQKIQTYFIPDLGPAPSWCHNLTGMTDKLEENPEPQIYDDYKFLTLAEMQSLGLTESIGQSWIRAEMHGYFIKMKLYRKLKEATQAFDYEAYKKKKNAKKNEPKSRITIDPKELPAVNSKFAERLVMDEKSQMSKDSRFAELFTDEMFQIDEESEEYLLQKPHQLMREKKRQQQEEAEGMAIGDMIGKGVSQFDEDDDEDEFKQALKQSRLIGDDNGKKQQKSFSRPSSSKNKPRNDKGKKKTRK